MALDTVSSPAAPAGRPGSRPDLVQTVQWLTGFGERSAGSDAERRTAVALRDRLRRSGREASLETIWVQPDWALVHALHCVVLLAGSLLSVAQPAAGLALVGVGLVSLAGDLTGRVYLLRRLTPRRATQNVVSPPRPTQSGPVRLIIAANTDAGRTGAVYGAWASLEQRLRHALHGHLPSPLGVLAATSAVLLGVAVARQQGADGTLVGVVQFVPTVVVVLIFAALLDITLSDVSPGASTSASAVAVALALASELDKTPARRLAIEVVLAGAGEGPALGMRAYARARRRERRPQDTVVLAIEPCGSGTPRWLTRDGQLLPLRFHPRLIELCERAAHAEGIEGAPYASHGASAAWPPRLRGWPAIAIGCRDGRDAVAHARLPEDTPAQLDGAAMAQALELSLALVGFLDDYLASTAPAVE